MSDPIWRLGSGRLAFPAGAGLSSLGTDGGGSGQGTDGGGSGKARTSAIMQEALRTTQAALLRPTDANDDDDDNIRRDDLVAAPAQAAAQAPDPAPAPESAPAAAASAQFDCGGDPRALKRLWRWSPEVRVEIVTSALLGTLQFEPEAVLIRNTADRLFVAKDPRPVQADGKSLLKRQAQWVRRRARLRGDRMAEIQTQMDDLWPFWQTVVHAEPDELPHTFELLRVALKLANSVVMQLKHTIACPRPSDVSPLVLPIIAVPGHGSFPSGHATAAHLLSELLIDLLHIDQTKPGQKLVAKLLRRLAHRVAFNREVAGVHFPIDSLAGQLLANSLAACLVEAAGRGAGTKARGWAFDPGQLNTEDLSDAVAKRDAEDRPADGDFNHAVQKLEFGPVDKLPLWCTLWSAADDELGQHGLQFKRP